MNLKNEFFFKLLFKCLVNWLIYEKRSMPGRNNYPEQNLLDSQYSITISINRNNSQYSIPQRLNHTYSGVLVGRPGQLQKRNMGWGGQRLQNSLNPIKGFKNFDYSLMTHTRGRAPEASVSLRNPNGRERELGRQSSVGRRSRRRPVSPLSAYWFTLCNTRSVCCGGNSNQPTMSFGSVVSEFSSLTKSWTSPCGFSKMTWSKVRKCVSPLKLWKYSVRISRDGNLIE